MFGPPGRLYVYLSYGRHVCANVVTGGGEVRILDDGVVPPASPLSGPRVGITKAVDLPWRFRVQAGPLASLESDAAQ